MRIKRYLASNQRKRTLHRNKVRLANRRHMQFSLEQYSEQATGSKIHNELRPC
ncbi:hypothetical protein [Cognaticolwellia aestuarii]|uniref:hypothetical protein n=1 Tax=Cognaticolwellia aestuarii TaxID=329993 RepID=UPI0013016535|nr:hypothetical protein [Cognaticolwellia aestuarii]